MVLLAFLAAREIFSAPALSCSSRQPRIETDSAPACAESIVVALLIPVLPPVMTTFLPAADSSGRNGEMNGFGLGCQVLVKEIG